MKTVKLNYLDGTSIIFNLDYFVTVKEDPLSKILIQVAYESDSFPPFNLDIDDFVAKVYSDSEQREYELIEIDEEEKRTLDLMAVIEAS